MLLSAGKFRGFQKLGDDNGLLKMVAIDQRNPIFELIMKVRRTTQAPYQDVAAVKDLLAKYLSPKSSAMLLDPIFAFPRALALMGPRPGLILAYEDSAVERTPQGLKSSPIPGWTAQKARFSGADAMKVLIWYRADAPEEVRLHQQAFVRAAGQACLRADIVHLVEVLIYSLPGEDPNFARVHRARLVEDALDDFLDPSFNIDIYKLEPPSALAGVPDPDGPHASAIQLLYDRLASKLARPWVLLSAGSDAEDFRRSLTYAYRAGANGYLCGRAIWKGAFDRFPDMAEMARVLETEALPYLDDLNNLTDRLASSWHGGIGSSGDIVVAHAGIGFPESYAA